MYPLVIYDPLYGAIKLRPWERFFVHSQEMRRLQNINQLSFDYFKFPGSIYPRLLHMLGTMYLATELIQKLKKKHTSLDEEEVEIKLRSAALLHDIGHSPFSHITEKLLERLGVFTPQESLKPHEAVTKSIILDEFGLSATGKNTNNFERAFTNLATTLSKSPENIREEIAYIITKKNAHKREKIDDFLHTIISGDIDIDRLDYLMRDAFYTGIAYGAVDKDLLIGSLEGEGLEQGAMSALIIEGWKGVRAAESFLLARDSMYSEVHNDPTCRAVDAMIFRSVSWIINKLESFSNLTLFEELKTSQDEKVNVLRIHESTPTLFRITDDDFLYSIHKAGKLYERTPNFASEVITKFNEGKLYEKILEIRWFELHPSVMQRIEDSTVRGIVDLEEKAEKALLRNVADRSYENYDVIVDIPSPPELEEAKAMVKVPGIEGLLRLGDAQISLIVNSLKETYKSHWTMFIYTKRKENGSIKEKLIKRAKILFHRAGTGEGSDL